MRSATRRQRVTLFNLGCECAYQVTQIFGLSVHVQNDHESTVSFDFGVTNTCQQVGEFANMDSANTECYILSPAREVGRPLKEQQVGTKSTGSRSR